MYLIKCADGFVTQVEELGLSETVKFVYSLDRSWCGPHDIYDEDEKLIFRSARVQ